METGTFLNDAAQDHIRENFIPVKYESGKDAEQFTRFNVVAYPTYIILDAKGDEVYRMIGYYSPEDLIGQLVSAQQIAKKL
jgi:thiol:disulfide interchange protein DsbD